MDCPACGAANPAGHRFCGQCGAPLTASCPACGAAARPGERFCGACGASLTPGAAPVQQTIAPRAPQAERRVVSILFADLVGFTALAEGRDPEDVRELLGRYFDMARTVVERYGGVVEKFIGDAVMALWGAPTAREDDAERAVRSALELCEAVATFGEGAGAPGLRLRAGVVTGEAAITVGAQGQGMVAGDSVNTASRIQSVAPPGGVLVDGSTRRASEAAIAYDDAGTHELKGKADAVALWRAARVVARVGGTLRGPALEAPFVGRDHELRLVKELFETTAAEGRARLVAVSGDAGIGKSRLAWEFEKYLDGIAATVLWHRGRCLAYGDGVAYRALADMVRSRARIVEGEDASAAREMLRAAVSAVAVDDDEARWIELRLGHLLDLDTGTGAERSELFAAWRLFFERLAATAPVVMLFEEMQWADAGLVDFVAYLLEWSRHHPLFVISLARPEFDERHPAFGAGLRSVHRLHLEPLSDSAMDALLRGLAPGLPDEVRERIRRHAEGVPLYAVETLRMLLDRGILRRDGESLVVAAAIDDLEVPASLHALVAARIDSLGERERSVVRDAAVLGHTFTRARLAALCGLDDAQLGAALDALVRREILVIDADPRSPERGQLAFAQALMQRVAYETLSRRDRRERHLAVARRLEQEEGDSDEVVEVVASHYLEAIAAAPDHAEAGELRNHARDLLERAGDRVVSLGAADHGQRYYARAVDLVEAGPDRGALRAKSGFAALAAGHLEQGRQILEGALEDSVPPELAARITARLGEADWLQGYSEVGVRRLEAAFAQLLEQGRETEAATVGAQLSRVTWLGGGDRSRALEVAEIDLVIAEQHRMMDVLANDLNTKGMILAERGRIEEAMALLVHAVGLAAAIGPSTGEVRARNNLSLLLYRAGEIRSSMDQATAALAVAGRLGDQNQVLFQHSNLSWCYAVLGEFDRALAMIADAPELHADSGLLGRMMLGAARAYILGERGDVAGALLILREMNRDGEIADPQFLGEWSMWSSRLALHEGDAAQAQRLAEQSLRSRSHEWGPVAGFATVVAAEAALRLQDLAGATAYVEESRARVAATHDRILDIFVDLAEALVAAARGDSAAAEASFLAAEEGLRRIGLRPALADALVRHAEWLARLGRASEAAPQLAEAEVIADALEATPLLARIRRVRESGADIPTQAAAAAPRS